jgi:RNA polymerase sigma factor (TIGR02999 family)
MATRDTICGHVPAFAAIAPDRRAYSVPDAIRNRRTPADMPSADLTDIAARHQVDPAYRARFEALYAQLQHIAHRELSAAPRMTLSTTVLVHEAFLRLDGKPLEVGERGPFLALAAKAMRCVLIDHVRARNAEKRGGEQVRVTLATDLPMHDARGQVDLMDVERGLEALEQLEPRLVTVVECRFYGGMEFAEIATHLDISERTVHRDWRRARAFLQREIAGA